MTSQQNADILLAEYQASKKKYTELAAIARCARVDTEFERDLEIIRQCMERK